MITAYETDVTGRMTDIDRMVSRARGLPFLPYSSDLMLAMTLMEVVRVATDGHFTLMGFTTGWKAVAETPQDGEDYEEFAQHGKLFPTAAEAICDAALRRRA